MRLSDLTTAAAPGLTVPAVGDPAAEHPPTRRPPADHPPAGADALAAARREAAVRLGTFRRTAVLVPTGPHGGPWIAEQGGVLWICAFSDEERLARFAQAQGEAHRPWEYRTVLGARLLDVFVPAVGAPAGVALDAGSPGGTLFPPVDGVVPAAAALDLKDQEVDGGR